MAYVEIRKHGKVVSRRQVDDAKAAEGCLIRLKDGAEVRLAVGESAKAGDYELSMHAGLPSEDKTPTSLKAPREPGATQVATPADKDAFPVIEGYQVTGRLGEGGMGTVWRAVQLSTRRQVALKFLSERRFATDKAKARFQREVELSAKLEHPNIARVYDSGLVHGAYYYAMEFVDGEALDRYIRENGLSQEKALELMRKVCQAVQYAHQRAVIHRDLKPSNILVTKDGQPHVLDFGLAKTLLGEDDDRQVTISIEGEIAGTPAYMSPEQAAGRHDQTDTRSDVYSLGVILYKLLTGQSPRDLSGTRYEVIKRIVEEEVRRPREASDKIDKELESLLLKALAQKPQERYYSAGELAVEIGNYLGGNPLSARPQTVIYRTTKALARHRSVALIGTAVALLVAIAAWYAIRAEETARRTIEAGQKKDQEMTQALSDARAKAAAQEKHTQAAAAFVEAQSAFGRKDYELARRLAEQGIQTYYDTPNSQAFTDLRASCDKAIKDAQESPKKVEAAAGLEYSQFLSDARAKSQSKDFDGAIEKYRRALAILPTPQVQAELKEVQADKAALQPTAPFAAGTAASIPTVIAKEPLPSPEEQPSARPTYPLWNGTESVSDYAKRVGIKDAQITLALDGNVTLKLTLIPAGKFLMGSPDKEQVRFREDANAAGQAASDWFKDEVQHVVTISKPFYMGLTHVTVDQFGAFVKDSGYETDSERDGGSYGIDIKDGKLGFTQAACSWRNPSFDQKGDHPVVYVTWNDAVAFCEWLSKKGGSRVSLPTEAQWEYACRAGTTTAFPWGDNPDAGKGWANCADQSLKKKLPNAPAEDTFFAWEDGYAFTSPVGSFRANAFGLYDMIGNAWEWCADRYGGYEKEAAMKPTGADTDAYRVLRGGSWSRPPYRCRSAARLTGASGKGEGGAIEDGFRVSVALGTARPVESPVATPTEGPATATQPAYPLWDGKETVANYAKRAGIKDSLVTLALDGNVTLKLTLIPAGKFLMGSPFQEQVRFREDSNAAGQPANDWFKDEVQHEVTISKAFYMGVTHVTVDQFAAFVKGSLYKTELERTGGGYGFDEIKEGKLAFRKGGFTWRNPSFDQKGDHPVVQVTWDDAEAFCNWLSKKSGRTVALPTEAQWEYACRAGTKTAYPWGDERDTGKGWANCADQSLKKIQPNAPFGTTLFFNWDDGYVFTSPVGSFKANAFGLYDMIGNAWQHCADSYGDYGEAAATDPKGADTRGAHVLRGGSWSRPPFRCRSAARLKGEMGPTGAGGAIEMGFRVVVNAK